MIIKNQVHNNEGDGERDEVRAEERGKVFPNKGAGMQAQF